jgi:hypothetical protein
MPDLRYLEGRSKVIPIGLPADVDWGAIAIAGDSEIDRCWIFPETDVPAVRTPTVNFTSRVNYFERGILVSAERPYIGHLKGNFAALLPYATADFRTDSTGIVFERGIPIVDGFGSDGMFGDGRRFPFCALEFFAGTPPWLPTSRAPREYVYSCSEFGTSGESSKVFRVPSYGRRYWSIAIEMTGRTAGSLNSTIKGWRGLNWPQIGASIEIDESLLATTTDSADFDRTYEGTAEFDWLEVTIAENAALNADAQVSIIVVVRDR